MDNLYFYLTLYDNTAADQLALNHGFFWSTNPDQAEQHITTLFVEHYKCDPSDIQCRLDTITASEILRLVAQRLSYDARPLRLFGVVIILPLPDDQRDMFINIAMAETPDELQELYYNMIAEKFPGYDLARAEIIIDEYEVHQILRHIADSIEP